MITQEQPRSSALIREPRKPLSAGQPCEDDLVDSDAYDKELITAVNEALASIDRGEFVTFEEIKKEFSSWFTE